MRKDRKRKKRSWHDRLVIGLMILATMGFVLTVFYVDAETWSMRDLFWQIPVLAVCYAYMALFCYSNNGLAIRKRTKKAKRTQEVRKAA